MADIQKSERAIVIISELDSTTPQEIKWLYRFIEGSGRNVASSTLHDDYAQLVTLYDKDATEGAFVSTLRRLGSNSRLHAIDVIIMLHGSPNELHFANREKCKTNKLADDIKALNLKSKLRMLYSTACFGASHADDFVQAGFTTAIGAKGVCGNAVIEFPAFLNLWTFGWEVKDALATADNPATTGASDLATKAFMKSRNPDLHDRVDSSKTIVGNRSIKISTAA